MGDRENQFPPGCARRFRPERILAAGGFGSVWKATQVALDRPAAVKVLHGQVARDSDQVERFVNEAKVTAALSHPHIVVILDHGIEDGIPWIAYEFIDGPSLRSLLARGPLDWREAMKIGLQVVSALEAAHLQGIIHRDIKPDNILQSGDGLYKVADFGIARWSLAERSLTADGMILGTPAYLSPMQIRGGTPGPESDIYALGATLYELMKGAPPFVSSSSAVLLQKHLAAPVVPLGRTLEGLPLAVDRILMKALAKERSDRYATASEMRVDLEEIVGRPSPVAGIPQQSTLRLVPPPPPSRRPLLPGLFVAGLVLIAGLAVLVPHERAGPVEAPVPLAIEPGRFEDHRRLEVTVAGSIPPGSTLILRDASGKVIASADRLGDPAGGDSPGETHYLFWGLPGSTRGIITLERPGGEALARREVETPAVHPVTWMFLMPMDDRLQIEILRAGPAPLTLEMGWRGQHQVRNRLTVPADALRWRCEVGSLKPETEYWIRGVSAAGWGGFDRMPVRTRDSFHGRAVGVALENAGREGTDPILGLAEYTSVQDRRLGKAFRRQLEVSGGNPAVLYERLTMARLSRDEQNFEVLLPFLERTRDSGELAQLMRAMAACDPARSGPRLDAELVRKADDYLTMVILEIAETEGIVLDFQGLVEITRRNKAINPHRIALLMTRADPVRAREQFRTWLEGSRTPENAKLEEAAFAGLRELGGTIEVDTLAELLAGETRRGRDDSRREELLNQLSLTSTEFAARMLESVPGDVTSDTPLREALIRAGSSRAADFLRTRASTGPTQDRLKAIQSLARQSRVDPELHLALLGDPDESIAEAAAWLLASHPDPRVVTAVLEKVRSGRDPHGVALFSLCRAGVTEITEVLRGALEQGVLASRQSSPAASDEPAQIRSALAAIGVGLTGKKELAGTLEILLRTKGVSPFTRQACNEAQRWLESGTPRHVHLLLPGMNQLRPGIVLDAGDVLSHLALTSRVETAPSREKSVLVVSQPDRAYLHLGAHVSPVFSTSNAVLGRRRHDVFLSRDGVAGLRTSFEDPSKAPVMGGYLVVVFGTGRDPVR